MVSGLMPITRKTFMADINLLWDFSADLNTRNPPISSERISVISFSSIFA